MMEDKDIQKILAKEPTPQVSVPAWNAMAPAVRKQNFLSFGFLHINIYNTTALLLLITFFGFSIFNNYTEKTLNQNTPKQTEIITPEASVKDINETVEKSVIPQDLTDKNITAQQADKKLLIEDANTKPIENIPAKNKIEDVAEVVVEVEDSHIIIDEPEVIPEPIIAAPQTKGKTIFVFETDTVVQYDTLVKNKKIKSRK